MSNNKQSSVEWYINITNFVPKYINLRDEMCNKLTIEQTNRIHFLGKQAKAMHKEELEFAFKGGMNLVEGHLWKPIDKFEDYYNSTFGGEDEQQ